MRKKHWHVALPEVPLNVTYLIQTCPHKLTLNPKTLLLPAVRPNGYITSSGDEHYQSYYREGNAKVHQLLLQELKQIIAPHRVNQSADVRECVKARRQQYEPRGEA